MDPVLRAAAAFAAIGLLAGCAARAQEAPPAATPSVTLVEEAPWRALATEDDTARIERLDDEWQAALASIRPGRWRRLVDAEGELLRPAAAQPFPAPPPGHYRCRVVRLPFDGRITVFRPWSCHVGNDEKLLSFTKEGGSDRPAGWLWTDNATRLIFLGAMIEGEGVPAYGEANSRSLIGAVERVADFRWRLVIPAQRGEASLDVIELIPMVPGSVLVEPAARS